MLIGHIQFHFEDDSKCFAKSTVMPKYIFHIWGHQRVLVVIKKHWNT